MGSLWKKGAFQRSCSLVRNLDLYFAPQGGAELVVTGTQNVDVTFPAIDAAVGR
jgi:hypothetical protein